MVKAQSKKLWVGSFFALVMVLQGCGAPSAEHAKVELVDPDSPGAQLLQEYCSDCHAPPPPSTHLADEWDNVVYRMQERRRMKAYSMMDEEQLAVLMSYLKQYAKKGKS
ncbi:MAG TPA: hypothetical protein ENK35_10550 [Candidatus Tenderia sp.]|nr:hypothetical protein [Candidatus Tenderia sp.]